ncbi:MAG: dienelactone hydrolase family protein [Candidatus Tectomicrobia bacterium]|uniref:Dienelactone hydrolase family protein n=1 Tax=Tectimicrobiota bacterium TaxID=2528274 RepID=A0A932CMI6_UNCTE|nr:dienelactone hydrolase family protein [Candidatus Tectomicrobia bacterium]
MSTQNRPAYEGMLAESVNFAGQNGDYLDAYLARPLGAGSYPGVILIHEAFGLVEHTKEQARKFAHHGFIAITPDLYHREGPENPDDLQSVIQRMQSLSDAQVIADLEGAVTALRSVATCNGKIGCIGHCSGGRHTVLFACNTKNLHAAVDCYGGRVIPDQLTPAMPKAVIDMIPNLSCPLLGLFGELDANPAPAHVARLEEELKKANKEYEFKMYTGDVGHGFFGDYRPSYRQEPAVDGWQRIFNFFDKHLR